MVTVKNDKQLTEIFKARGLTSVYDMEVSALSHAMERVGLAVGIEHKKIVVFDISDPESSFEVSLRDVIAMTTERLKAETPDSQVKQWKFLLEITASKCASEDTNAEIDLPDLREPEPELEDNENNAEDTAKTEQDFDDMTDFDESDESEPEKSKAQQKTKQSTDEFNYSYRNGHRFGTDDDGIESNANDTDEDAFGEDGDDDDEFEVDPDADQESLNGWNDLFSDTDSNARPEQEQSEQPEPQHEEPKRMSWVDRVFRKRNTQQVNDKPSKDHRAESRSKTELWPDENYTTHTEHKPEHELENESDEDNLQNNELNLNFDQTADDSSEFDVGFDQDTESGQEDHEESATTQDEETREEAAENHDTEDHDVSQSSENESETKNENESEADQNTESQNVKSGGNAQNVPVKEDNNKPKYFKVTIVETYTKSYMVRAKNEATAIAAVQSMWNRMNKTNTNGQSGTLDKKSFADLSIVAEQVDSPDDY